MVTVVAIAACVGDHYGTTQQLSIIQLSNQDYTFPAQFVDTVSDPHTITISPASGEQSDTVTDISLDSSCGAGTSADFTLSNVPTLPQPVVSTCSSHDGSGDCIYTITTVSFSATFSPHTATSETCKVYITLDGEMPNSSCDTSGAHQCVTLTGTSVYPAVFLTQSQTAINFNQVRVGDTTPRTVTFTNFGSDTSGASVTSVSATPNPPYDIVGSDGDAISAHTLAANGGTETDTVTCHPTTLSGPITGTVDFNAGTGSDLTISLTCTPIMSNLKLEYMGGASSASIIQFAGTQTGTFMGETRVNEPVDAVVTLANDGTASLVIHSVTLGGVSSTDPPNPDLSLTQQPAPDTTLDAGESTPVTIHWDAATATTSGGMVQLGTLNIAVNDNGEATRTATLQGGAVVTRMALQGDGDLGPVCAGIATSKMVAIQKTDNGTFAVTAVSQPDSPFTVTGGLPGPSAPIAVTGLGTSVSDPLTITVNPGPSDLGPLTSSFQITTDIPQATPFAVAVTATALPAGISPTPVMLDFGAVGVNATSTAQMVTITNCNATPLTLLDAQITGTNLDDFAIVIPPGLDLDPARWCRLVSPGHLAEAKREPRRDAPDRYRWWICLRAVGRHRHQRSEHVRQRDVLHVQHRQGHRELADRRDRAGRRSPAPPPALAL